MPIPKPLLGNPGGTCDIKGCSSQAKGGCYVLSVEKSSPVWSKFCNKHQPMNNQVLENLNLKTDEDKANERQEYWKKKKEAAASQKEQHAICSRQVAVLVAVGVSKPQMASILKISDHTVESILRSKIFKTELAKVTKEMDIEKAKTTSININIQTPPAEAIEKWGKLVEEALADIEKKKKKPKLNTVINGSTYNLKFDVAPKPKPKKIRKKSKGRLVEIW